MSIACIPLSAAPEAAETLARWFLTEWPDHFAGRTVAEVEAEFPLSEDGSLPLVLVARRGEEVLGTASLRDSSILNFPTLTPWLGGLLVHPAHRRTGVARALLEAAAAEAQRRGYPKLYAGTVEAQGLFDRLGWARIAETVQEGEPVTVYERALT